MKRFFYENGLGLALIAIFVIMLVGHGVAGFFDYSNTERQKGKQPPTPGEYLISGHFVESVFENWESEFLQMAAYVIMTRALRQRGSVESRKLKEEEQEEKEQEEKMEEEARKEGKVPWAVTRGGIVKKVYGESLWIAFALLFLASFFLHGFGGVEEYNEEQMEYGQPTVGMLRYMITSRFWFESFQNWQSEFLAVWAIVVFSIFLRSKDSAQSKPVAAAHSQTGH